MEYDGTITILVDRTGEYKNDKIEYECTIRLEDKNSTIGICEIKLTENQFMAVLSRLGYVPCKYELIRPDLAGLKHEWKTFEFLMPEEYWGVGFYQDQKKIAREIVEKLCPEGWIPDKDFASQNSFFSKDRKLYARTTIRRYV